MPAPAALPCSHIREYLPFFRMLFDDNKIGIILTDAEGVLVYCNKAQENIDDLPMRSMVGRKLYEVYNFTPDDSPGMQVLRTEIPVIDGCHYYRTRHGKMVYALCDIYPIHSEKGLLLGAICYVQGYSALVTHMQNVKAHLPSESSGRPEKAAEAQGGHYLFSSLVGRNKKIKEAAETARLAAQSASPVMLIGETGVGKEIFAQAIHYESARRDYPYTAINCSAVPETLLEGILFGTTKGAFTGAANKEGLFEVSNKGTLFLDELDSMPIGLQSKLLRVLQEKKVRRVGDVRERSIDLKIISSVRSEPIGLIQAGVLRADFYYRLGVVKIAIPPLRERPDDLGLLIEHFLAKHCAALKIARPKLDDGLRSLLYAHNWPGNVRELEHAVEAMLNLAPGSPRLELVHLIRACPELARIEIGERPDDLRLAYQHPAADTPREVFTGQDISAPQAAGSLTEAQKLNEAESIRAALKTASGNRSLAARLLGISPQLLYYKVKKHGLNIADFIPEKIQG